MESRTIHRSSAGGIRGKLTDRSIKASLKGAQPGKKLADGGGLHLFVTRAGNATWRVKYRMEGKEKTFSIGPYPSVSLSAARIELDRVKQLLRENRDPVAQRRVDRAVVAASTGQTFKSVAEEWLGKKKKEWGPLHFGKSQRALERDVYPALGNLPIASITPAMAAHAIEKINKRDVLETATRILQHVNGIFRYAQAKGLCRDNPAASVREILPRKPASKRMAALVDWESLGEILRTAELARISPAVRMAHRLCAFTAARIGNIVTAEWREFELDRDQPVWTIPREKMKVTDRDSDHRIPLGKTISGELITWCRAIGSRGFLFPSPAGGKNISRESLEKVYRVTLKLKGRHSPHGWRSAFSTLARENGANRDVVERLCHFA